MGPCVPGAPLGACQRRTSSRGPAYVLDLLQHDPTPATSAARVCAGPCRVPYGTRLRAGAYYLAASSWESSAATRLREQSTCHTHTDSTTSYCAQLQHGGHTPSAHAPHPIFLTSASIRHRRCHDIWGISKLVTPHAVLSEQYHSRVVQVPKAYSEGSPVREYIRLTSKGGGGGGVPAGGAARSPGREQTRLRCGSSSVPSAAACAVVNAGRGRRHMWVSERAVR